MQFIVLGHDGTDPDAPARRSAVREAHLALADELRASGQMHYAAAMLNDAGVMCGSMLVVEFETRTELDAWLAKEPYVRGKVWERTEVIPCRVAPAFQKS